MSIYKTVCLTAALALFGVGAVAQDARKGASLYVGTGTNSSTGSLIDTSAPYVVGIMFKVPSRNLLVGFDFAGEGTSIDSTWGRSGAPVQATSFNMIVGATLAETARTRTDAGLIIGLRNTSATCASSFLGYRCYADAAPDMTYGVNVGAIATVSFDGFMIGLRATGESAQVVAGLRF